MADSQVQVERQGEVAIVRLDRPPANALTPDVLADLIAALEEVAASPPGALVVAGRDGVFSAGADLKLIPNLDPAGQREMVRGINGLCLTTYALPFPVIAAVTGHAIAGGFVFAMCSDLRIAGAQGRYGLTEVRVGVPYPAAAIGVVRAELGAPAARFLALGAGLVDAAWCLRHGAFDEVVDDGAVLDRALALGRELAQMPAEVYSRTKRELRGQTLEWMRDAVERDPLLGAWVDDEGRAAAQGALAGRTADPGAAGSTA
ncbi:MAG TPA: enoyl-CoA hydratase/isomerase family protein [Solirubrobacteraceae bacterium]|nr:enoyl-CoA hydratase/isomerase family protein [Solirubrobacteraceae bacterium]